MAGTTTTLGYTKQVILGAGKWYLTPYTSGEINLETVAVADNLLGYTQGGATVTYTPETYTIEDDIGMIKRTFMVKADAEMKTGILTFDVKSLSKTLSVGKLTENADKTKNTLKLGGGREELKRFIAVFEYAKDAAKEKYIRVGMVATNTAALELAFAKDKETVPEITFTADTNGEDDTILVIEEDVDAIAA